MSKIPVVVNGCLGKMGREAVKAVNEADDLDLVASLDIQDDLAASLADHPGCVVVDFTHPTSAHQNCQTILEKGCHGVIGTTGLGDDDEAAIDAAARQIPVVQAANFSLVVNVLTKLAAQAAAMLGDAYDIEVVEAHHKFKKDAPSGTALAIARALCEATGRDAKQDVRLERAGDDVPRRKNEITVQALRLGDVVGEHTVMFGAPGERMELRHIGTSRDSYATGALHAAKWLAGKPAGRYTMADVLGLGD